MPPHTESITPADRSANPTSGGKVCSGCKLPKERSEFGPAKNTKSKLRSRCRVCEREDNKIRYSRPEAKERRRAQWAAYYASHKEELLSKVRPRVRKWQKENRDRRNASVRRRRWEVLDHSKARQRKAKLKLRREVLDAYGGRCCCCAETAIEFLTIDHIHGGGSKHVRSMTCSFYGFLKKSGYPEGYQVLCWNCNFSKHYGRGTCCHKRDLVGIDFVRSRKLGASRVSHQKLKLEVVTAMGGHCACCAESLVEFLSIDHINGDGAQHRREMKEKGISNVYYHLRDSGYPDGFQVLCINCNMSKHYGGGTCYHMRTKTDE